MKASVVFLIVAAVLLASLMIYSGQQVSHEAYCKANTECSKCTETTTDDADLSKCPSDTVPQKAVRVATKG